MLTRPQNAHDEPSLGVLDLAKLLRESDPSLVDSSNGWQRLLELAIENKLVAAFSGVVERSTDCDFGPKVRQTLTKLTTEHSLRAIHQVRQLHRVLDLFESAGIPVLTYKGLSLAQLAFASLAARQTSDLDLLVAPEDYRKAYQSLLGDGFVCDYPRANRHMWRQSYEISLFHPERLIYVDLHRAFLPACYRFDLHSSALTPYFVTLMGREVATLAPTEHLLVLCAHGSKHGWRELRWLYDLHRLCQSHEIDWDRLGWLARRHGAACSVAVGLELSRQLFATSLKPQTVKRAIVEQTLRQLGGTEHAGLTKHRYQWMVADDGAARCRYLAWTLFYPHQRDLDFVDLPTSLWPLYYLVRPFRIAYERIWAGPQGRLN